MTALGPQPYQPALGQGGAAQPFGKISNFFNQNPELWTSLSASLIGGPTLQQGFQNFAGTMPGIQQASAKRLEGDRQKTAVNAWLKWKSTGGKEPFDPAMAGNLPASLLATMYPNAPDPTDDMREYGLAKTDPAFASYMEKTRGGTTVNVGPTGIDYGQPEKGTAWKRDAAGKVVTNENGAPIQVPIGGGSVEAEAAAAAAIEGKAGEQQQKVSDVVTTEVDRAVKKVEANPTGSTGFVGGILKGVGGSDAADVAALTTTIKANTGFDALTAMRAASKTGAALGAISDTEMKLLTATIGSLEQSQSSEQLLYNLKRVKNVYLDTVHGVGKGPPREKLETGSTASEPDAEGWITIDGVRVRAR